MFRAGGVGRYERQIKARLGSRRQFAFSSFSSFFQTLQGEPIFPQVDTRVLMELVGHPIHDALVKIFAAQISIARRGQHFEDAVVHFQDGNIKRAAAQIIDRYLLSIGFAQAISQRRRRRLVNDSLNFQACNSAGILSRLPLGVVKVGGHSNDCIGYRLTKKVFGRGLQTLQHNS